MNVQETVNFLNTQVAWEPGLSVHAWSSGQDPFSFTRGLPHSRVTVTLTLNSLDSSAVAPDGTYSKYGPRVPVSMSFDLSEYETQTREQVLARVIAQVTGLRQHETREFTRIRPAVPGGKWEAPFHPHTASGNILWRSRGRKAEDA